MKMNKGFIVFAVGLFVVMLLIDMHMPRRYDWKETYSHYDDNPLGCALFDSVLATSIPAGYHVTGKTLAQINEVGGEPATYLMVEEDISTYDESIEKLLKRGNNLIVATTDFSNIITLDTLLDTRFVGFGYEVFGSAKLSSIIKFTVEWQKVDNRYQKSTYELLNPFIQYGIRSTHEEQKWTTLLTLNKTDDTVDTLAVTQQRHKGRVTLVMMPLLFTNYGISHDNTRELAMRLLTVGSDGKAIVRLDSSIDSASGGEKSESPLRYLLNHRPLRWALYMALIGVLLALVFTARRRQRIIPVINKPENHTLEMAEHIGTLYFERHDNHDMLLKKYFQFAAQLRRLAMVDLTDSAYFDQEVDALALYSTLPRQQLADDIKLVWNVLADEKQPSDHLTAQLCDKMDAIIASIKQ